jgi:hypothetical protein
VRRNGEESRVPASQEDPRAFWEARYPTPTFDGQVEQFEDDFARGQLTDEQLGLFLFERLGNFLRNVGDGLYTYDHPDTGTLSTAPLPHDLAARYLHNCATALERLATLEAHRSSAQGEQQ